MASSTVLVSVRELIRRQELIAAVERLEKWLNGRAYGVEEDKIRNWLDELILHDSSVRAIEIKARRGLITEEEEAVQLRQISQSILRLIVEIENRIESGDAGPRAMSQVDPLEGRTIMKKNRILFLSANPTGTTLLKLAQEAREIEEKIRAAEHRDSLELITKWAVRPDDLLQSLNQYRPHVVHFSVHGSPSEEIILLDKQDKPKPVNREALVSLFRVLKDNIRVVLLNACFSRPQAEAITEEIDCAIGMMRAIGDEAAIIFAASFYRAIGFGRSVRDAFEQGKTALLLEGIQEERTPVLMTRRGVVAESIILIRSL
jgi:hypothetical protein